MIYMKEESKPLIFSMFINFLCSSTKLLVGIYCESKSMIADGFHSISGLITDVVAYFGTKLSYKKANKKYPEGFGRVQYIIDLFIATVVFLIGVYTIYNSIINPSHPINVLWIIVIIFTVILKLINSRILMLKGIKHNSPILITISKESEDDMITSLGVVIIIILSQFSNQLGVLKYADTIGGVILGLLIIKTSLGLYKDNILSLLGEVEDNYEIETRIKSILNNYEEVEYKHMELVKNGNYYSLELYINILKNIRVYKLLTIESDIRNKIKKLRYPIKFIDINLGHRLEEKSVKQ